MRQPLRKIEAVDGGQGEAQVGGAPGGDRATAEIGMIFAAGRVVFMSERMNEKRSIGTVNRGGR